MLLLLLFLYPLTECIRQRKKNGTPVPHELDVPPELDI
jgi:hypothetical protein